MKATTKFTPGPWVARKDPNAMLGDDWMIGRPSGKPDEVAVCSEKDARLIAAAPMLFDALSELVEDYEDRFDMDSPSTNPWIKSTVKHGRAALAAARGTKE